MDHALAETLVAWGRDLGAPLPPLDHAFRIARLQAVMADHAVGADPPTEHAAEHAPEQPPKHAAEHGGATHLDALLVTDAVNLAWLCGFTGSAGRLLVPARGRATLLTDARYGDRAADECAAAGADVRVAVGSLRGQRTRLASLCRAKVVGLEGASVSWSDARAYEGSLGAARLVPTVGLVESCRRAKDAAEVVRLARAAAIADAALLDTAPLLAQRCSESAFRTAFVDRVLRLGADAESFDAIIAAGPNGARPHHATGARTVRGGELVICDLGALVDGYHSDTTRTVCVGRVPRSRRAVLDACTAAEAAGRDLVGPGVRAADVDRACRAVLRRAGLGGYGHGTGHGVGLLIHESPWVNGRSADVLAPGDVVTVEPGVYRRGEVGVRVEDTLLVTDRASVRLTRAPYSIAV